MGSVIGSWNKPTSVEELTRAVFWFVEDSLGLGGLDERDEFEGVLREVGDDLFEADVIVVDRNRDDGWEWWRLDKEMVRLVTAWVQAGRPPVDRIPFTKDGIGSLSQKETRAIQAMRVAEICGGPPEFTAEEMDVLTRDVPAELGDGGQQTDPKFTPVKSYNRPRTRLEFAQALAAFAQVDLGMTVNHTTVVDDQPARWIELGLDGLDARIDNLSVVIPDEGSEATGITGNTERELLEAFRAKLVTLDLDEHERHMSVDRMPKGYTFDLLTDDEVEAVERHRKGKARRKRA